MLGFLKPGYLVTPVGRDPPLSKLEGCNTVKKLVLLALVGVGVAVWNKVEADRAELDLWTEATTSDNYLRPDRRWQHLLAGR